MLGLHELSARRPLRSACFHRFQRYYEAIRLLNLRKLALGFVDLD